LKAPSDAAKVSLFSDWVNADVVFTPKFDPDRCIKGRRLSYFNPFLGDYAGEKSPISAKKPNQWFRNYELAVRLYRTINKYEWAAYFYQGYWKCPAAMCPCCRPYHPDLNVYGASVRGPVGKGIGNAEVGYYQSRENESGSQWCTKNSELRFLTGYTQELAKNFTAGVQYYLEHMADFDNYYARLPIEIPARDEFRHLVTLRLTQLLLNQNLRVGIFTYYSPSDKDVYTRPNVNYKISDNLMVEGGANIFFGDHPETFFAQFHRNSNFYGALRFSF